MFFGIRDPGSEIRDGKKPGSGIRDKHPGSATLGKRLSNDQRKLLHEQLFCRTEVSNTIMPQ